MTSSAAALDPYTTSAENKDITVQEKINGLQEIVKGSKVGMLTTRSAEGSFHSRAMTPASPYSDTQLTLVFLANNASHKFEEIENDAHVNVSFLNSETTAWASFSGKAKVSQDKALIKKYWSSYVSAYFGDLKDGTHKGDENDPRISVIEVVPDEIRYWKPTKGAIGRAIDAGLGAMTGRVSAPGELRTITKAEIQLTQALH
ncbi:Protein bli-3 [Hypsizygus marmoreus]|uniref:Protein bli-3 n=1 Tax=Hypsizygus marmoreus TaxID=39966 RepID=A0A369JUE7_HYPMA|nr:Protein bli-3 [Hypsizygus marmoreus]